MPPAALEILGNVLATQVPSLVSMPVAPDPPPASVGPFGLTGSLAHRRFRRHLEVTYDASAHVDLLAMFGGRLSWVSSSSAVASSLGPAGHNRTPIGPVVERADGSSHLFRVDIGAFVLRVTPLAPLRQIAERLTPPASPLGGSARWTSPLELPEPAWIVYEGSRAEWDIDDGVVAEHRHIFEGLPVDFPTPAELTAIMGVVPPATPAGALPAALEAVRTDWAIILEDLARRLIANPALVITVIGHQDSMESALDAELGARRAQLFRGLLDRATTAPLPVERVRVVSRMNGQPLFLGSPTGAGDTVARAPNRRVEVVLARRDPPSLAAGGRFASTSFAPGGGGGAAPAGVATSVRITILDQKGRFLDPLDVVRRYDLRHDFVGHRLASRRDPHAPAIASGWVHCVTDFDALADGVVEAADEPFFTFEQLQAHPDGRPSLLPQSTVDGLETGDILWLDVKEARAGVTIRRPITLVGLPRLETDASGDQISRKPTLTPDDSDEAFDDPLGTLTPPRTITVEPVDPKGIGVRVLGLEFARGASDVSSGAVFASNAANLHVARCAFHGNRARPLVANGGAIALENCHGVLIEDSVFRDNSAHDGGAIFGESCQNVVVAGRALAPDADAEFDQKRRGVVPLSGLREHFSSVLERNAADGRGGAIAFHRSTFRIVNSSFHANRAQGVGGAVAAALDDPGALAAAKASVRESLDWPTSAPNAIVHCLISMSSSPAAGSQVALWGAQDNPEALVGEPRSAGGGGVCYLEDNIMWGPRTLEIFEDPMPRAGGAALLASGVFVLSGNRISEHMAHVQGGGVSCLADAYAYLRGNLIDQNTTAPLPLALPDDAGAWGGGGVYAAGFSARDRTLVQLTGNTIENNLAPTSGGADGGAVLAACGARIVCGGTTPLDHNTFRGNGAGSNGGAISVRNADLEVRPGEIFRENRAEGGDGGAIFVAGMSMHASPVGHNLYLESAAGRVSPLCAERGARLHLEGSIEAPVQFDRNEAGGHGAAIAIVQEPAPPLYPPTPDSPRSTAVNRTVGLLRTAAVRHARFVLNRSDEAEPGPGATAAVTGSTVLLQGLDNAWIAEYDGLTIRHVTGGPPAAAAVERDAWLVGEPLGACAIADVEVTLDQGVGVLAVRSTSVAVTAQEAAVTELTGRTEGDGWRRYASASVDRPLTR
jgi:predicted outer membrane repeat protein